MNLSDIVRTIDFEKRAFSLVLVEPKIELIALVDAYRESIGLDKYPYYQDDNLVLVVPSLERFTDYGSFSSFRELLKPTLLLDELSRFDIPPSQFLYPITSETFDMFFTFAVRDTVKLLSDYKDLNVCPY